MSDKANFLIRDSSAGGLTATHLPPNFHSLLAGPATSRQFNTYQPDLNPVACCSLYDNRFDFDSSFIKPESAREFGFLAALRKLHPGAPVSIFGHTDAIGDEDYNKTLSGRRAEAVHALLVRDVAAWERLYNEPFRGDDWGTKSVQVMLDTLLYDPGRSDGVADNRTLEAVKAFQRDNNLPATGNVGPQTRPKLFLAYMDVVCRDRDGAPYKLTKEDLLARGADPKGKGDYQGCGEFNQLLVPSQADYLNFRQSKDHTERNALNARNRRVIIYLFRPGTRVTPALWPCPRTREGFAACRARFWSDADDRRGVGIERREYQTTQDTFACRFYDRLAATSPCERQPDASQFLIILENEAGLRIPEAEYEITFADGTALTGRLGLDGTYVIPDPPLGPVAVTYKDLDDIKAKSLAACIRQAFSSRDAQEIYRVLGHSPQSVQKAAEMYDKYFNDHTGGGLIEDIYAEITDPDALMVAVGLMARAGLPTRERAKFISWADQHSGEE